MLNRAKGRRLRRFRHMPITGSTPTSRPTGSEVIRSWLTCLETGTGDYWQAAEAGGLRRGSRQ